jgi:hypothetical protein
MTKQEFLEGYLFRYKDQKYNHYHLGKSEFYPNDLWLLENDGDIRYQITEVNDDSFQIFVNGVCDGHRENISYNDLTKL